MKIKAFVALICALALAFSMAAFADEAVLISENNEKTMYVNGEKVDAEFIVNDDNSVMAPVRKICETLGFNVEWNAETNDVVVEKTPMYFTFNIYKDGYTVARTAPMLLGKAPVAINCTTYLPMEFYKDIMKLDVIFENNELIINSPKEKTSNTVIFSSVVDNLCVVYDIKLGDVLVNISSETVLSHELSTFEKGQLVEVVYDDFMTMSLPPITNAIEFKKLEGETAELVNGVISEVIDDGVNKQIVIKDDAGNDIALNIGDKTILLNKDGENATFDMFAKDVKISAVLSMAATRSLPPQRAAYAVRIVE